MATGSRRGPPPGKPFVPSVAFSNRDWIIPVECTANAILLPTARQRFPAESFVSLANLDHPLAKAVRQMIARRQAMVRPGEPAYRPSICFQIRPDGLRSYYLAYPVLENLGIPMARQELEAEPSKKPERPPAPF
jgi:hypothetical protein